MTAGPRRRTLRTVLVAAAVVLVAGLGVVLAQPTVWLPGQSFTLHGDADNRVNGRSVVVEVPAGSTSAHVQVGTRTADLAVGESLRVPWWGRLTVLAMTPATESDGLQAAGNRGSVTARWTPW